MSKRQIAIIIEALRFYSQYQRRRISNWKSQHGAWDAGTANEADDIVGQLRRELIR